MKKFLCAAMLCVSSMLTASGQEKEVPIAYGNMDHWVVRHIKESAMIGGNEKTLYEIGPDKVINGNVAYRNLGNSPWGTSNVMAKVMGIVKTNQSVYRERRGNGYCAKMETHIEKVKVLGMVNISVLAAGSVFLGDMREPISGTKDGEKALNWGIRYTQRPKAIRYDYKVALANQPNRIKQTGFSKPTTVAGRDCAIMVLLLQRRYEDAKGNITAKRVGTVVVEYNRNSGGWVNNATYDILYGDIRNNPKYNARLMGLRSTDYARNSKGRSVPVREIGWASANETPSHMVLQFSSSNGGAFVGSPGNTFWIDNVRMVF